MNTIGLHDFLLYSLVINYAILLIWFGVFVFAHDFIYRMHTRWFSLPLQAFDTIHYAGMAAYKIGIILLNLVPLIALCIIS
ncbi:hypothetical protein MTYP_00625 [Methylophilaceae bacterium]|nr:hypothetical protein MTYP_00625 [Methylophilaceae bacterium]